MDVLFYILDPVVLFKCSCELFNVIKNTVYILSSRSNNLGLSFIVKPFCNRFTAASVVWRQKRV